MRLNVILRYMGMMLLLEAIFMLIAVAISIFNGMDGGYAPLLLSFLLTAILGAFPLLFVEKTDGINSKESFGIVIGAWLISCVVGMFPYLLWGGEFDFTNAWFESVSGFTTTGATILNNVEAMPKSLLFWRSTTHWLGGVGVVMFALVVLPVMGKSKLNITNVELSSIAKDNYQYSTKKIVHICLSVYLGLTLLTTLLLKLAGMGWFDAVNHAFSISATGGFSTKNMSIGAFDNVWIEVVAGFFMLISGLHFGLIFATLAGKSNNIFRSEVCRYYFTCMAVSILLVTLNLYRNGVYETFGESLRYSSFQLISYATTTGVATTDTNLWMPFSMLIAIMLSIQCACSGSTSGGLKCDRMILVGKIIKTRLQQQQHPNAVFRIKVNGVVQDYSVLQATQVFIILYIILIFVGALINAACGMDLLSSVSFAISSVGNVGIGFGDVGSMENCANLPVMAKYTSTLLMLLGRLEIFGLIQLFLIKWWV